MRNALACVGKKDRPIVTAALRTTFDQDRQAGSKEHWAKLIKTYKTFPQAHWRQIHSTNPIERLNKEIKRRTNVVGIPQQASHPTPRRHADAGTERRMGGHTSLHDTGNRRRHLRRCHHGPGGNRRPVNRLNTQPENILHHSVGHYRLDTNAGLGDARVKGTEVGVRYQPDGRCIKVVFMMSRSQGISALFESSACLAWLYSWLIPQNAREPWQRPLSSSPLSRANAVFEFPLMSKLGGGVHNVLPLISSTLS